MAKLVRDLIPELIKEQGGAPRVRVLHDNKEYLHALNAKLREELKEYEESYAIEELADIIEVVEALQEHVDKISGGALNRARSNKRALRGGFAGRIYLLDT